MRRPAALRGLADRYRLVAAYVGLISAFVALVLASPILLLVLVPEDRPLWWRLLLPAALLGAPGFALWRALRPSGPPTLTGAEAAVVVVLSWAAALTAATGSLHLLTGISVIRALFEAASGLTTTGLSTIDVSQASATVLLLRSVLQLAGGAGLAILMVSFMGGPLGGGLSAAEGRGEQLVPNVARSARVVVRMYALITVVGAGALWLAGMGPFDAINHSMAAVSTGGFSTKVDSIGYWASPAVEAVTIVLMVVGTTNFMVLWAVAQGQVGVAARSGELRLMAAVLPVSWLVLGAVGFGGLYPSLSHAGRVIVFETVSALSTTGFQTVSYVQWPVEGWLLLSVLMTIGGGTGSTAGGLKQLRVVVLTRAAWFEVTRALLPASAVNRPVVQVGGRPALLDEGAVARAGTFTFVYLSALCLGIALMVAYGVPLGAAVFEMSSTLGTAGLSVGVTAADSHPVVLGVQTLGMMLGRLEFFVVAVGLMRLGRDLLRSARALVPSPR